MSGFTKEIILKNRLINSISIDFISKVFSKCLQSFFKNENIKPFFEFYDDKNSSVYFFLNEDEENEKLISFLLETEIDIINNVLYLSIVDNSSDTSEYFNSSFFHFFISSVKNEFKSLEAYLLADSEYYSMSNIFEKKDLEFIAKWIMQ